MKKDKIKAKIIELLKKRHYVDSDENNEYIATKIYELFVKPKPKERSNLPTWSNEAY